MKKIISFLSIALLICPLFAQTKNKFIDDAVKYESEKNYIYAWASYYDAFEIEKSETIASKLNDITQLLLSGNLTYDSNNIFEIHDAWVFIAKNYEKYWTENCPYDFTILDLEQSGINFKDRTYSYSTNIKAEFTEKYKLMASCVTTGFRKVHTKDWEINGSWPTISVYNGVATADLYEGVALVTYKNVQYPAALINFKQNQKFYDIVFDVCDENNKVLFHSGRKLIGSDGDVIFKGVSAELKEKIDSKKVKIVPVGLFLQYGKCSTISNTSRLWVKPLPEISFDLSKVVINCGKKDVRIQEARPQGTEQIDEKTEDNITVVPELIVELEEDIILEERPQGTEQIDETKGENLTIELEQIGELEEDIIPLGTEQTEITKENSASENSDAK